MIKNKYPTTKPSLNLDFANTKSLDPRITFRRGTTGAYYDGVTHVKAEENLIKNSERFDLLWDAVNIYLTTDLTDEFLAPNGTQTAVKISDKDTNNSNHAIFQQVYTTDSSQEIITTSIFAKAGDADRYLQILHGSDDTNYGFPFANFDLFNGTITRNEETLNASMTDAGNGWYRCSITFFTTTLSGKSINPVFYMVNSATAGRDEYYVGDASSGFYIWGAQLEQRDSATVYTKTEGAPITKYQPKLMNASPDEARFDHDPITGESKGLLIEESRTNLLTYSQDFSHNVWVKKNTSIKTNCVIAPDGTLTADKIICSSDNATHQLDLLISSNSIGDKLTSSVYVKAGEYNYAAIALAGNDFIGEVTALYDLSNGTLVATDNGDSATVESTSIEGVGNGWYRITVSSTAVNEITGGIRIIIQDNDSIDSSWTGDGYSGIYIWGAQLETGSFPTSYIKTTGASATRSADDASITGKNFSSWYRQDEGSLYSEVNTLASSSGSRISMSDGTSDNRIFISNGIYPLYINKNGDIQVRETSSALVNVYSKRAVGLKKNDFALSIDGGDLLVDASGDLPFVDRLAFSTSHISDNHVNGHIKKLAYYPQRLTNEQLQNLTK